MIIWFGTMGDAAWGWFFVSFLNLASAGGEMYFSLALLKSVRENSPNEEREI